MQKIINIQVLPNDLEEDKLYKIVSKELSINLTEINSIEVLKKSIDARRKPIKFNLKLNVFINEYPISNKINISYRKVNDNENTIHIVGAGPAGLFAALEALTYGIKPIIYERGKDVRERRRDLAKIHKEHIVNSESNYCFGEGGAGTYSDGKLYTRSKKKGVISDVLKTLIFHGADKNILVDTHPHIGTNKLPRVIENIRRTILNHGGEIHFNSKLEDFRIKENVLRAIIVNGKQIEVKNLILATGHSARDIYFLLEKNKIELAFKPFALGVRIEHSQSLIDFIQYHGTDRGDYLPAAAYSLVTQIQDRGVYSFCMCPGGIVAPCATSNGEVVTNGWSPSKRNNPFANSGIVVEIKENDLKDYEKYGALKGIMFQKNIEQKCWEYAGKSQKIPGQRLLDFINNKKSIDLPKSSYQPGLTSVNLNDIFPGFISKSLRLAFNDFGKKMKGFLTNDAVLHAPESRTSSAVKIPRNDLLEHPNVNGLFPCGEGSGYAGGIVSAAIDGIRIVEAINKKINDF